MSLLIYAESAEGKFKKVAFELASYAKKVAESFIYVPQQFKKSFVLNRG